MVAVGLTALLTFDLPMLGGTISDLSDSIGGVLLYLVLPFGGGAWLLAKSWRFLLAATDRPDFESRRSRPRPGRRDDWRLDA
jgi:hypothetical protein